ncbi:hypothetical protein JVU11DRAFT_1381 [Chiua virens]|nr:hypothetical protein JVU11DRAFT_1381 [Chiua virens]
MKKLLQTALQHAIWSPDREQVRSWMKDIKERIKDRMLEIQPSGFKYIVLVQISENLNQGGRADMISHWEDGDACVHELFYNVRMARLCFPWTKSDLPFAGLDYLHLYCARYPKFAMNVASDV